MKPTKKQLREVKLLDELRLKHDYLVTKMDRKTDRFTSIFKRKGKTMVYVPAVMLRLAVPATSAMGKLISDLYKKDEKPKAKKKR
jgi:hypothetical protein